MYSIYFTDVKSALRLMFAVFRGLGFGPSGQGRSQKFVLGRYKSFFGEV